MSLFSCAGKVPYVGNRVAFHFLLYTSFLRRKTDFIKKTNENLDNRIMAAVPSMPGPCRPPLPAAKKGTSLPCSAAGNRSYHRARRGSPTPPAARPQVSNQLRLGLGRRGQEVGGDEECA